MAASTDHRGIRADLKVRRFFGDQQVVDGAAIHQLIQVASRSSVEAVAALPGVAAGDSVPSATVALSKRIHPSFAAGSGNGVALYLTDIPASRLAGSKFDTLLQRVAGPWAGNANERLAADGLAGSAAAAALLGTGRCEILKVEEVVRSTFLMLNLDSSYVLVEGGAGEAAEGMTDGLPDPGPEGYDPASVEAKKYLERVERAAALGRLNRKVLSERVNEALGSRSILICDAPTGGIELTDEGYVHLMGAMVAKGIVPVMSEDGLPRHIMQAGHRADEAFRCLPRRVSGGGSFEELVTAGLAEVMSRLSVVAKGNVGSA